MASKRVKDGPHWVKAWISELSSLTDQFRDIETGAVDFEALGREEYHFRMALSRRDFSNSERARNVWEDAVGNYQQRIKAASKDKNRKETTGNDQVPADGDTREDSQAKPNGSAITRNETRAHDALEPSANIYATRQAKNGDAPHREAGDESATVSNHFTTKKPSTISANERRTGGSIREAVNPLPPVRQSEPDVMSLAYSGEFGNVRLTQAQYNELGIRFGNLAKMNRAIDSLSCKIENGETNPRNHYAELVKWANYRDDMDEAEEVKAAKQPHYETVSEHNARVVAEGKKWIDEHFPKKDKKNG